MEMNGIAEDDESTEKVLVIERAARAIKAVIELLIQRNAFTHEELQHIGKAKKTKKDFSNRLAKIAWIFDSIISALEGKAFLSPLETESIYSLRNARRNHNRAAGLGAAEFVGALIVLLDFLVSKELLSRQEANDVLKRE